MLGVHDPGKVPTQLDHSGQLSAFKIGFTDRIGSWFIDNEHGGSMGRTTDEARRSPADQAECTALSECFLLISQILHSYNIMSDNLIEQSNATDSYQGLSMTLARRFSKLTLDVADFLRNGHISFGDKLYTACSAEELRRILEILTLGG